MVEERALLLELRERIRRLERPAEAIHGVLPFGIAAIDRALPGGGLALGALHEILGTGGDEEDGALAAAFVAGIIGRLGPHPTPGTPALAGGRPGAPPLAGEGMGRGMVLWCLSRRDLYGPGLTAHGLDPAHIVQVQASRDSEILWAMEEGLRASGILAVVGEVGALPAIASRRLQLAAERSGVTAFLLRRWRDGGQAARERSLPNAAVTRWRITALPSQPPPIPSSARGGAPGRPPARAGVPGVGWGPGGGCARWRVELVRCRGGEPACWEMEVADATGHVSLAAALADRPAAPLQPEKFRLAG
jgi:protein ImuA